MATAQTMYRRSRAVSYCGVERLESRCLLQATAAQYTQVNLVSDGAIAAAFTDAKLVNAWGLAAGPTGPFQVANNGTGTSTQYNAQGQAQPLVVTIPSRAGSTETAAPTGEIFNGTSSFVVSANGSSGPATFLFATEQGTISGWNSTVNSTNAVIAVDNSASGAIYKGLASATADGQQYLYATDFHNGKVDVFDGTFTPVTLSGGFTDKKIPKNYAPFGIASINGKIYVSYARQDKLGKDDVPGRGRGFVDIYSTDGVLVKRLIRHGRLNAPWGMTVAPANFGAFSNDLLVGNFGNGIINAYDPTTGKFVGTLKNSSNRPLKIKGLWGLSFGNGDTAGATNTLFFTAGPDAEQHGLFGQITANNPTGTIGGQRTSTTPTTTTTPGTTTTNTAALPLDQQLAPTNTPGLTDTTAVQPAPVLAPQSTTDALGGSTNNLLG